MGDGAFTSATHHRETEADHPFYRQLRQPSLRRSIPPPPSYIILTTSAHTFPAARHIEELRPREKHSDKTVASFCLTPEIADPYGNRSHADAVRLATLPGVQRAMESGTIILARTQTGRSSFERVQKLDNKRGGIEPMRLEELREALSGFLLEMNFTLAFETVRGVCFRNVFGIWAFLGLFNLGVVCRSGRVLVLFMGYVFLGYLRWSILGVVMRALF